MPILLQRNLEKCKKWRERERGGGGGEREGCIVLDKGSLSIFQFSTIANGLYLFLLAFFVLACMHVEFCSMAFLTCACILGMISVVWGVIYCFQFHCILRTGRRLVELSNK